jgi:hypothetical protein
VHRCAAAALLAFAYSGSLNWHPLQPVAARSITLH